MASRPQLARQVNRLRQPRRQAVSLVFSGPRALLRNGPTEVEVTPDHTWLQVLTYKLQVDVAANPGIFISTIGYSPNIAGRGSRFDLTDPIMGLVNKYPRKTKRFCARICLPPTHPAFRPRTPRRPVASKSPPIAAQSPQGRPNLVIPTQGTAISSTSSIAQASTSSKSFVVSNRPPTPYPSPQDHLFKQPLPPGTRQSRRRSGPDVTVKIEPNSIAVPIFHHDLFGESVQEDQGETKMEVEIRPPPNGSDDDNWGEGDEDDTLEQQEDDDVDDNFSVFTTVAEEAAELRREGIRVEEIKSTIEQRLSNRFSNGFMLRVQNELRQLRNNNLWDRNANRAPLCSYLLTEMFQV